jgi:Ca2+-binding RTX toxin-like protein
MRSFLSRLLGQRVRPRPQPRRPIWRPGLEALEDRMVPALVWNTSVADHFGDPSAFGSNAQLARNIVNQAIADWNAVVQTPSTINVTIVAKDANGAVSRGGVTQWDASGRPFTGKVTIGLNQSWFLDSTPADHSEFEPTSRFGGFNAAASDYDLYTVALHELGHVLGIDNTLPGGLLSGSLVDTPFVDPSPVSPTSGAPLYAFNGATAGKVTFVMADGPHIYDGELPASSLTSHLEDLMNPGSSTPVGARRLISDLDAQVLGNVYGYNIPSLPSQLPNRNFAFDFDPATGHLKVFGDPNKDDLIQVSRSGNNLLVSMTGQQTQSFSLQVVTQVSIYGHGGNDTLGVSLAGGDPIPVGGLSFNGGAGDDQVFVTGTSNPDTFTLGSEGFFVDTLTVGGGALKVDTGETERLEVQGQGGADTFNVQALGIADTIKVELFGGTGDDIFNVGDSLHGMNQFLAGDFQMFGEGGYDKVTFNDSALTVTPGGNQDYILEATSFTRETGSHVDFIATFGSSFEEVWVKGTQGDNTFQVNGQNAGTKVTLLGNDGDDKFVLADGKTVSGQYFGGDGFDTVDYSAWTTPVTATLSFSVPGGLSQIENVIGGKSTADTLVGVNQMVELLFARWRVTGQNAGSIDLVGFDESFHLLDFQSFEKLTGGSANDTFLMQAGGSLSGTVNGGGGLNTLDYSEHNSPATVNLQSLTATATGGIQGIGKFQGSVFQDTLIGANAAALTTWSLSGANAGSVNGPVSLAFAGVENLTGGTGNDKFAFTQGATLGGTIDGGDGLNTLDYSGWTTAATIDLSKALNIDSVVGGGSTDTLIGRDADTNWDLTGNTNGTLTQTATGEFLFYSAVESVAGGSGADSFKMHAGVTLPGSINGGGGTGKDTLDYSAFNSPVQVNLTAGTATGVSGGVLGIENVKGGAGADILIGDGSANVLNGNGGNDILSGLDGSDNLDGGSDRDLVIGGSGSDTVIGGTGDDIVIGASTLYDANAAALTALLAEWKSSQNYDDRLSHLQNGGGLNGAFLLNGSTVIEDFASDDLFGNSLSPFTDLGRDWFWAQENSIWADVLHDRVSGIGGETVSVPGSAVDM